MSGHQERRSDGWERREAPVLRCHLGGLAVVAALAVGFIGAPNANGAPPRETSQPNYFHEARLVQAHRDGNAITSRTPESGYFHYYLEERKENGRVLPLRIAVSTINDPAIEPSEVLLSPNSTNSTKRLDIIPGSVETTDKGDDFGLNYNRTIFQWRSELKPSVLRLEIWVPAVFRDREYCVKVLSAIMDKVERRVVCWLKPKK